ncbi:MAG: toxin-antitoxin system HicB family antitoxin [Acidimicrobiaceae bacterium]|nr:toxin-antitoxin system HicB family antitoxin [Acidimicrobiaceae bacterium]
MNGHDRYSYRVIWSDEDEMYVGLCAEFGLLSHLDDTPEGAFAGIRDVVAFAVESLHEDGAPIPEPLSTRRYSGTLTLRVPPETHRILAMDAAEAGVSMNRLAAERLMIRR